MFYTGNNDGYKLDKIQIALKNAEMSARMEGLVLTPQLQKKCLDVITGKRTLQDLIEEIDLSF